MRLALFSDIHGNLPGLEAVLAAIDAAGGADGLICAGDALGGGPGAGDVLERLAQREVQLVQGNHEEMYLDDASLVRHCHPRWVPYFRACAVWLRERLSEAEWARLGALPGALRVDPTGRPEEALYICHATPRSVWEQSCGPDTPAAQLEAAFASVDAGHVAFGHFHPGRYPDHFVRPAAGKVFLNVSSVGRRLDGVAAFTIAQFAGGAWTFQQRLVPYDVDAELHLAAARAVPDPRDFVR